MMDSELKRAGLSLLVGVTLIVIPLAANADDETGTEEGTGPSAVEEAADAIAPPATMETTGDEPATSSGGVDCSACHDGQAQKFAASKHAREFKHKDIPGDSQCAECHGPGDQHAEAAGDRSNPGFSTINNMLGEKSAAACLKCHTGAGQAHWKGSTHDSRGVGCSDCHSIHSGHEKNLKEETEAEVCAKCHANVRADLRRTSHHPIGEGKMSCSDCHNPHGAVGPSSIEAFNVNEKCYECHAEKRGPFLFEHRPVSEDCTVCHQPHGSNRAKLLARRVPFLCQQCHSNSRHPGTIYAADQNVVHSSAYEVLNSRVLHRACLNCHQNIHGSNHPSGKTLAR